MKKFTIMVLALVLMAGTTFAQMQRKSTRLSASELKKVQAELLAQKQMKANTMSLQKKAGQQVLYNGTNADFVYDYTFQNGDRRFGPQESQTTKEAAEWFTLPDAACTLNALTFNYSYLKENPSATDTVWFFIWDGSEGWLDLPVPAQTLAADQDSMYTIDMSQYGVSFAADDKFFAFGYYCNDWQPWDIAWYVAFTLNETEYCNSTASVYNDISNLHADEDAEEWVWYPYYHEEEYYYDLSLQASATITVGEGGGGEQSSANLFTALLNETGDQLVSATSYNFGNVNVGQSGNVAVYVANNGTATGTITAASLANTDGIFSVQGTIGDLAPNDYMDFAVTFRPTAAGQKTNTLVFTTSTGTLNFSLIGTGVSEGPDAITNAKAANIAIYPNPAKDMLTIANAENAQISIYNLVGQEVRKIERAATTEVINVADLAKGSYIVKIMNEGNVATQKFNVVR